jgi:hypothetical protein
VAKPKSDIVSAVSEVMPAYLPRRYLEDWSQELFSALKDAIVGAFVKISNRNNKYRLVQIVDLKQNLEAGESGVYTLGKDKTSHLIQVRYGDSQHWSKLTLLSNKAPDEDEFKRMLQTFKVSKVPELKDILSIKRINEKGE